MKKYLATFLLLTNIVFMFTGCAMVKYNSYKPAGTWGKMSKPVNPFDEPEFEYFLFKLNIIYSKYEFSGLLVIKLMDNNCYRLVFITEMGMKIFDFELKNNQFNVIHMISYLDKKPVVDKFEQVFRIMLHSPGIKSIVLKNKNNDSIIVKSKLDKYYNYYYFDRGLNLKKTETVSMMFKKYTFLYANYKTFKGTYMLPSVIRMQKHGMVKYMMNFNLLEVN